MHSKTCYGTKLINCVSLGKILGKDGKRRPRKKMIDNVIQVTGCQNYQEMKRKDKNCYSGEALPSDEQQ